MLKTVFLSNRILILQAKTTRSRFLSSGSQTRDVWAGAHYIALRCGFKKKRVRDFSPTLFFAQSHGTATCHARSSLVVYGLVTCKLSLPVAGAIGLMVIV
jgi:hypothetical protein